MKSLLSARAQAEQRIQLALQRMQEAEKQIADEPTEERQWGDDEYCLLRKAEFLVRDGRNHLQKAAEFAAGRRHIASAGVNYNECIRKYQSPECRVSSIGDSYRRTISIVPMNAWKSREGRL